MSNIQVYQVIMSNLMLLQQGKLHKLQQKILHGISRTSRPEVFYKEDALKAYAKFTGNLP